MSEFGRVEWGDSGQYVTDRQHQAIKAAQRAIRKRYWGFTFSMPQGSWKPQTSYSGTTHTNAGVCDLQYWNVASRSRAGKRKFMFVLMQLKKVGQQAAFGRGPADDMPYHFHVCDLETDHMDPNAQWQVSEYRQGNNGLNSGVNDRFEYRPTPIRKWDYQTKKEKR